MKNKTLMIMAIFPILAGTANAEDVWVKSGGIERFLTGTTLTTNSLSIAATEKTANYTVNFKEDAKYVFGFSANYDGASYMTNTAQVMFGIVGEKYSVVVGKSADALLCASEFNGVFFSSASVYSPQYAFTANPQAGLSFTGVPNTTTLDATLPKAGSYSYEITLTTSSSGNAKIAVEIPELNKRAEFDLKLAGDVVTSYVGLRLCGIDPALTTEKQYTASVSSGISVQKFVLQKTDPSVPEPSAFGLLAGLGALALSVSRRRRK